MVNFFLRSFSPHTGIALVRRHVHFSFCKIYIQEIYVFSKRSFEVGHYTAWEFKCGFYYLIKSIFINLWPCSIRFGRNNCHRFSTCTKPYPLDGIYTHIASYTTTHFFFLFPMFGAAFPVASSTTHFLHFTILLLLNKATVFLRSGFVL